MDLGLDGKVALVTGGSKGIGRASAQLLAEEGCRLAIAARTQTDLDIAAKSIEASTAAEVLAITGDMTKTNDVERAVTETLERFGQIDILVTCAGSSPGGLLEDLTEEQWQASLQLKFMGYVRSTRAVISHMREQGS